MPLLVAIVLAFMLLRAETCAMQGTVSECLSGAPGCVDFQLELQLQPRERGDADGFRRSELLLSRGGRQR